jgi:hypothetical protein
MLESWVRVPSGSHINRHMEIERLTHEGVQYILGAVMFEYLEEKIPYPYISITSKSSKKNREKKLGIKHYEHFNRLEIKNPVAFFYKAYHIFDNFLKDYDYVAFSANEDSREKRERVYQKALERMGFKLIYVFQYSWRDKDFLMARNDIKIKKKDIKRMKDILDSQNF